MKSRPLAALSVLAVAGLALTACSSGSPSVTGEGSEAGSPVAEGELTQVTVGLVPLAASIAVEYGIQEGIFAEHGLDVEIALANAGAAMLPAVSNGQMDFGVGNPLSVLTAVDQGLDMKIVAGYCNSADEGEDTSGVVTRVDAGIEDYGDLAGRTTSINALRTLGDLTLMDLAEQGGSDPADVRFAEMPFQDMPAQLEQGNTDAIWIPEPFLTTALEDPDNELLGYSFRDSIEGMPTMVTFTSGTFAEENPETVEQFQAAITEALAATDENNDEAKKLLPEFMNLPEEAAMALKLDELGGEIREEQLQAIGELAVTYDFIDAKPDLDAMIVR
ncbi:ABC transporter substrate-binding protein [Citricoccus sp. I39-566]|uniref:ABC transporter substrate-binding protein n=1 Tax=Citricoccus sp. I39-566 TaxID=3073268 RepID=UPI00286D3E67|nr:ABC transporter substrate-binding protein [Citricoccus sp. I39-566]WMY79348.1 ABC transporter substrate-binding protein [Citricoccus sp. I39-566]